MLPLLCLGHKQVVSNKVLWFCSQLFQFLKFNNIQKT